MKKAIIILISFLIIVVSYGTKPIKATAVYKVEHHQNAKIIQRKPVEISIVDNKQNLSTWLSQPQNIISLLTLIISIIALTQVALARAAIKQGIKNRNLGYLTELDRFLIDEPKLWQFYDVYKDSANPIDTYKLKGFIYYKLNHFEITLSDKSTDSSSRNAWYNYMIYCLQHSTEFSKEVESILLKKGYKGLFEGEFLVKLAELYKEAFDDESKFNSKMSVDYKWFEEINKQYSNYLETKTTDKNSFLLSKYQNVQSDGTGNNPPKEKEKKEAKTKSLNIDFIINKYKEINKNNMNKSIMKFCKTTYLYRLYDLLLQRLTASKDKKE